MTNPPSRYQSQMHEHPAGDYVRFADYDRLAAQVVELQRERDEAQERYQFECAANQQLTARLEAAELGAARWTWWRSLTGAYMTEFVFPIRALEPHIKGVNLMRGSVAGHLDKAVDQARAALDKAALGGQHAG